MIVDTVPPKGGRWRFANPGRLRPHRDRRISGGIDMIARMARMGGVVVASACLIISAQTVARAADGTPGVLTLDKAFTAATGKTIDDQPASLRHCDQFA